MGIIIPEGYSNCSFIFTCLGSVKEKVTSLGVISLDLVQPTAADIADQMQAIWSASGRPFAAASMTNDYTFKGCSVTQTVDGFPVVGTELVDVVGTVNSDSPPSNTAVIVKKVTAAGGRKNRGRMFVPPAGLGEASIDSSGFYGSGTQAAFQALYTTAIVAMVAADLAPFLFHSDATDPTPITALSVESQVATQRRRMR